jgi:hypothetical protein
MSDGNREVAVACGVVDAALSGGPLSSSLASSDDGQIFEPNFNLDVRNSTHFRVSYRTHMASRAVHIRLR